MHHKLITSRLIQDHEQKGSNKLPDKNVDRSSSDSNNDKNTTPTINRTNIPSTDSSLTKPDMTSVRVDHVPLNLGLSQIVNLELGSDSDKAPRPVPSALQNAMNNNQDPASRLTGGGQAPPPHHVSQLSGMSAASSSAAAAAAALSLHAGRFPPSLLGAAPTTTAASLLYGGDSQRSEELAQAHFTAALLQHQNSMQQLEQLRQLQQAIQSPFFFPQAAAPPAAAAPTSAATAYLEALALQKAVAMGALPSASEQLAAAVAAEQASVLAAAAASVRNSAAAANVVTSSAAAASHQGLGVAVLPPVPSSSLADQVAIASSLAHGGSAGALKRGRDVLPPNAGEEALEALTKKAKRRADSDDEQVVRPRHTMRATDKGDKGVDTKNLHLDDDDDDDSKGGHRFRPYQYEQWTEKFQELCNFRNEKGHW